MIQAPGDRRWQVALGILALAAGAVGVASSERKLGALLTIIGVADLLGGIKARRRRDEH
jgi:uncharacterized membrane protein HdeD (DUF308 family)